MSNQTDLTFFSHPVDDETTNQQRKQVGLHYKVLTDTRATGTLHIWATIQVHYTPDPWCRYVTHLSNDAGKLHTWATIQARYTPEQRCVPSESRCSIWWRRRWTCTGPLSAPCLTDLYELPPLSSGCQSDTAGLTHITAWTYWQTYCIVSHSRPDTHHSLDLLTDILYCLTL